MYSIKNNRRKRKERRCHLCTNEQKIKNNIPMHINNEHKQYINVSSDKIIKEVITTFNIINNENLERPKTPTTPELINIVLELEQLKNKFNEKAINTVDLKIETATTVFKKLNL